MIKLDVKNYCHDCPHFEPEVLKATTLEGCTTYITCENASCCSRLYKKAVEIEAAASIDPDTCE